MILFLTEVLELAAAGLLLAGTMPFFKKPTESEKLILNQLRIYENQWFSALKTFGQFGRIRTELT
ncbi:hypothetical protein [Roseobacter litoralis]|uniref:hypothetical protein n=1 Tax=Roseobacter litoralis TaxID=42443 RepID=UPI0024949862|nr:hypothetical protein [Roseobacter litoralis]